MSIDGSGFSGHAAPLRADGGAAGAAGPRRALALCLLVVSCSFLFILGQRSCRRRQARCGRAQKKLPPKRRHIPSFSSQTMLAIPSDPKTFDLTKMKRRDSRCLARIPTSSTFPRPAAPWISSRWRPLPTLLYLYHLKSKRNRFDKP